MRIGVSLPVRELRDDLGAIREFAQAAESLGFRHLRVPEQVMRPESGPLHEPMTLLAWVAALTEAIELVPSVIILPLRQTALVAKQAAELDRLSEGRLRMGVGVGSSAEEFEAMGIDFSTRGARCDEQIELLRALWTRERVDFEGRFHRIPGIGLDPLPVQRPIPLWIGPSPGPSKSVIRRIGRQADGWFVICSPEEYPRIRSAIESEAREAGRDATRIGSEAGVAVVGPREAEWPDRVAGWQEAGLSHLCLRTLGGGLDADAHLRTLRRVAAELP